MTRKILINIFIIIALAVIRYAKVNEILTLGGAIPALPDLLLIFTVCTAIFNGGMYGMIFGFAAGMAVDFSGFGLLGFFAFMYTLIGYLGTLPGKMFEIESPLVGAILVFIFLLVKGLLYLILGYIFMTGSDISHYFTRVFLVEVVLTILMFIPTFLVYRKIYKKSAGFKDDV